MKTTIPNLHWFQKAHVEVQDTIDPQEIDAIIIYIPKGSDKPQVKITWVDGTWTNFLFNPHFDNHY